MAPRCLAVPCSEGLDGIDDGIAFKNHIESHSLRIFSIKASVDVPMLSDESRYVRGINFGIAVGIGITVPG